MTPRWPVFLARFLKNRCIPCAFEIPVGIAASLPNTAARSATFDTAACRQRGFTLIELIVFIVVAGIVGTTLIHAFGSTMRGSHLGKEMTQAAQLAQQRMEVIAGQRNRLGYANFNALNYDPCQLGLWVGPPQVCATTTYAAGTFGVTSTPPVADSCGAGCTAVSVTVTSPYGGILTVLTQQFWNY